MGTKRSFKWNRAIPIADHVHEPPFQLYSFPPVRQIATVITPVTVNPAWQPYVEADIPASWWADGKTVLIRTVLSVQAVNPTNLPGYQIQVSANLNGLTRVTYPNAPLTPAANAACTFVFEHRFIRIGDAIINYAVNAQSQVTNEGFVSNNLLWVKTTGTTGPYDFTVPFKITIELQALAPTYPTNYTPQIAWAWAESPTNVRQV